MSDLVKEVRDSNVCEGVIQAVGENVLTATVLGTTEVPAILMVKDGNVVGSKTGQTDSTDLITVFEMIEDYK